MENFAGEGIRAKVDGYEVYAGNEKLMHRAGVVPKPCECKGTIIHLATDGSYAGHIVISDTVKPQSSAAIARLKSEGIEKVVMLTGDRPTSPHEVAGPASAWTNCTPACCLRTKYSAWMP